MEQDETTIIGDGGTHDEVRRAKKMFFAYRNGMLADRLRDAGDCHSVIFGLNIPQLVDIANELGQNAAVARELWHSGVNSRECRLLAPMLFPPAEMGRDEARQWVEGVENVEVADNMCHKLLRRLGCARGLVEEYAVAPSDLLRYTAFRLAMNLLCVDTATADWGWLLDAAKAEISRNCNLTQVLCNEIIEEISYR